MNKNIERRKHNYKNFAQEGLQTVHPSPRSESDMRQRLDVHYSATFGYERDEPIVNDWLSLIPEKEFFAELVVRHIRARSPKYWQEIINHLPDKELIEAMKAVERFHAVVEKIRQEVEHPVYKSPKPLNRECYR